jgi:hypothetical protein
MHSLTNVNVRAHGAQAALLREAGWSSLLDILSHYPRRYDVYGTRVAPVAVQPDEQRVAVLATVK